MTWYNSYRPKTFDDVVGQDLIKKIMKNSIAMDKIKHAYLLSGPHGVGKTTLARIFASELNDLQNHPEGSIDVIEMDAASHTSIEDIRNLIESSRTSPIHARFKIYIIDEVHMLSKPAMNALLKVLEEPPSYLIFLLATTNPEKLIETVLSRVSHLKLHAHSLDNIKDRLRHISKKEGVVIDEEALEIIAEQAKGSQRDAINLLETVSSNNLESYTGEHVSTLLGLAQKSLLLDISEQLLHQSLTTETIQHIQSAGLDGTGLLAQLLSLLCRKSLEGDKSFDTLIPVIADVLGQKLPLPEPALALAVIQSTLNDQPSVALPRPTQTPPEHPQEKTAPLVREQEPKYTADVQEQKPATPEQNTAPEKKVTPPENSIPQDDSQDSAPDPVATPETKSNTSSNLNEKHIYQALTRLQQESNTPPTFKMILPDIEVGEFNEADFISLELKSSGIFLKQLQSTKLKSWIQQGLTNMWNKTVVISTASRVGNKPRVFEEPVDDYTPAQIENTPPPAAPIENIEEEVPIDEAPSQEHSVSKIKEGEIFYSVYKKLPIEMEDGTLPVTESIPIPESSQTNTEASSDNTWDEHAEEMFDLE